jgi:hypothetical protein
MVMAEAVITFSSVGGQLDRASGTEPEGRALPSTTGSETASVGVTRRRRLLVHRIWAFRRVTSNQHCRFRAEYHLSLAET